MSATSSSLREALEKAYDTVEEAGGEERDHSVTPIVDDTPSLETHSYTEETSGEAEHETSQETRQERQEAKTREEPVKTPSKLKPAQPARQSTTKPNSQARTAATTGTEQQGTTQVAPTKAPISWRPQVRQHWEKLPEEVRQEILKRETEVSRGLSDAANSRKFHQEFSNVVRPFEALIRSSGVNPIQATQNLMTTAATLQTGTPQQKAQTVANIIRAYGVDISILDHTLAGKVPPKTQGAPQADIQALVRQELQNNPLMQERQREIEARKQAMEQQSAQTIEEFAADPKNDYYEDLREDMADLLELSAKRGRVMTMQEAYDRAAQAHPEISKLLEQRRKAEAAAAARNGVSRARRASVSQPSGTPAAVGRSTSRPNGSKAALNQAWDDLSA